VNICPLPRHWLTSSQWHPALDRFYLTIVVVGEYERFFGHGVATVDAMLSDRDDTAGGVVGIIFDEIANAVTALADKQPVAPGVTNYDTFVDYGVTSSQEVDYVYDYLNRLVARTADLDGVLTAYSPETEYYIHDGGEPGTAEQPDQDADVGQIVLRLDENGTPTHRYLWGPAVDQILADEVVDDGSADDVNWTLTDHQNSVRDIVVYDDVSHEASVVNHITYDSYGNVLNAVDCLFAFTGRLFDSATGLQNNLNRWYDASLGRWLSEDPIGFAAGDANLYRYVANDPGNKVDSLGLEGDSDSFSIGDFKFFYRDGKLYYDDGFLGVLVSRMYENRSRWDAYDEDVANGRIKRGWGLWISEQVAKTFLPRSEPDLVILLEDGTRLVILGGGPSQADLMSQAGAILTTAQAVRGAVALTQKALATQGATRGLGGRILTSAEQAEFKAFAARAQAQGLVESPYRTGSWGRWVNGKFVEVARIDVGEVAAHGWGGRTHIHNSGQGGHLPPNTPIPGE
jgi:RHS repeat-associated protein